MEVRDLFALAMKRRGTVLLVLLLTTGAAAALAFSQPKRYESKATIALTPDTRADVGFVPSDTLTALVRTYAQTARSRVNIARAERLNDGRRLPGKVETATQEGAGILEIIGRDTSPQGATVTARLAAQAFLESIADNRLLTADLVNPAAVPSDPVQPRPPLIIGVAALLGLIAGFMLAYALEHLRRRVETAEDIAEFTPAPVIGRLPRIRSLQRSQAELIWNEPKMMNLQEGFRAIRTNIEFVTKGRNSVIQITSPNAAQGKSTIVANLGMAFAQVGVDTLILDADLRRPFQDRIFALDNRRGLSTLMAMPDSGVEPVPAGLDGLWVMPSGPVPPNSTEMLHIRFERVLDQLRERFPLVLVDSPPILPVSDARLIAPCTDGVMMVVAAGSQKPAALTSALEKLTLAGANLIGVVLNQADEDADQVDAYDAYRYEQLPKRQVEGPPVSAR
jgi:succinoglycan biosynthesis transport protein ExoP